MKKIILTIAVICCGLLVAQAQPGAGMGPGMGPGSGVRPGMGPGMGMGMGFGQMAEVDVNFDPYVPAPEG